MVRCRHHKESAASNFIENIQSVQGFLVGCLEEIALANGWLKVEQIMDRENVLRKSDYGRAVMGFIKSGKKMIEDTERQKVALVTGGAGNIGNAICARLADRGFIVKSIDLNRDVEKHSELIRYASTFHVSLQSPISSTR